MSVERRFARYVLVLGLSFPAVHSTWRTWARADEPPDSIHEDAMKTFIRGDANDDGSVNLADAVFSLAALYRGGPQPGCKNAADANSDRAFDFMDAFFTIQRLFAGGSTEDPAQPGCSVDASPEALSCESYVSCAGGEEVVIFAGIHSPPRGGPWTAQGPGPSQNGQVENCAPNDEVVGAIHVVLAHPTDANTLWIGGANAGIWRTTNATNASPAWAPLTDGFPSLSIGAMDLDPTDATNQTIVAGIGRFSSFGSSGGTLAGLLRTTDGGNTWQQLGQADLTGRNVTGVGARGTTILVSTSTRAGGTSAGVYRSTDNGASFQNTSGMNGLGTGQVFDLAGDPGTQARFYAAVAGAGIFRTDDTGANWVNVTDAAINAVIGGTTNNIELAVHNNAGGGTNAVYVAIMNNGQLAGFFRSANQGGAWTAMDIPQTNEGGAPWGIQPTVRPGSQGATHFSILADRTNANLVYVGGDRQPQPGPDGIEGNGDDAWPNSIGANDFSGRLFRGDASVAATGGVPSPQWTPLTHSGTAGDSSPHADSRDMVFDANNDIIEVDDGGIFRRTSPGDATGDWAGVNGNLQSTEFHDVAFDTISNILIGGAQDTGVPEQVASGGATWRSVTTADGGDVAVDNVTLAVANMSIRYWSNQNLGGFRRRTCDNANVCGGSTNIGLNTVSGTALVTGAAGNVQFVTPVELNVVDPTRLIIGGANSVYESTDQGDNVSELNSPGPNSNAMVYGHPDNIDLIYIGSGAQVFVRTAAGGNLVATAAGFPGGTVQDLTVDPADQNVAYAIDGNGAWVTPDGGATWDNLSGNISAGGSLHSIEYIEGAVNDILIVGADLGVFASVEPLFDCWFELGTGLPNAPVWDLDYDPGDDLIAAGTLGRGAWTLNDVSLLTVPVLNIPGDVFFEDTCVGDTSVATLPICNTGMENLLIEGITSSDPQFTVREPSSGYPVVISPDFCFPFQVLFTPTSEGDKSATLTVESNDLCRESIEVEATGTGIRPRIATLIANSGDFGNVCVGSFKDLELLVNNSGGCDLNVTGISSSSPELQPASAMTFPLRVHSGDTLHIPVRLRPTSFGLKAGTITVNTNDPTTPAKAVAFSGNTPSGDIRVTGSTDFGDVCSGELAEKTISICNVGPCNLQVASVAFDPPCPDFTLINNPFPATVSPDSCLDVVIRFTPTSAGPKTCTLVITSDDPDMSVVSLTVTGNTPVPSIDVPPDQFFSPTVISVLGPCETAVPFPVSNTGTCLLTITEIKISQNTDEYSLEALPSFPILLEPGHIAGEGELRIVFTPSGVGRERSGEVSVTYVDDEVTGSTTTVTRKLCGEGVKTGARVLATAGGVPIPLVEKIQLHRINANRNREAAELDTVDNVMNVAVESVSATGPCVPFKYHREYGTVSNPTQLLPGFFQVSVTAVVGGKRQTKIIGFHADSCDFNADIIVEF